MGTPDVLPFSDNDTSIPWCPATSPKSAAQPLFGTQEEQMTPVDAFTLLTQKQMDIAATAYRSSLRELRLKSSQRTLLQDETFVYVRTPVDDSGLETGSPYPYVQAVGWRDRRIQGPNGTESEYTHLPSETDLFGAILVFDQTIGFQLGKGFRSSFQFYVSDHGAIPGREPVLFYQLFDVEKGRLDGIVYIISSCQHSENLQTTARTMIGEDGAFDRSMPDHAVAEAMTQSGWICSFSIDENSRMERNLVVVQLALPYPRSPTMEEIVVSKLLQKSPTRPRPRRLESCVGK